MSTSSTTDWRYFTVCVAIVTVLFCLVGCGSEPPVRNAEEQFDVDLFSRCVDNLRKAETGDERASILQLCRQNAYVPISEQKGSVSDKP